MSESSGDAGHSPLRIERLLDRLDALRVLRERDESQALAELEAIGVSGPVEAEMMGQLAFPVVLAHPGRFPAAHRTVMKALEVLDRNQSRMPTVRVRGPLRPVAAALVAVMGSLQIEWHERKVLENLGNIYRRRDAQTEAASVEHMLLRRARRQVERIAAQTPGGGMAISKLLAGGAALSFISAGVSSLLDAINAHWWAFAIAAAVAVSLALSMFWVVLQSAAVARRRIRITLDEPLRALYETIGGVGDPPRDWTRQFVVVALVSLVVGWVLVPVAVGFVLWPD